MSESKNKQKTTKPTNRRSTKSKGSVAVSSKSKKSSNRNASIRIGRQAAKNPKSTAVKNTSNVSSKKSSPKQSVGTKSNAAIIVKSFKKTKKNLSKTTKLRKKQIKRSIKRLSKKIKKSKRIGLYRTSLTLLIIVIVGGLGVYYGHKTSVNVTNSLLTSSSAVADPTEAPGQVSVIGPAQNNPDFSTYPSWAQNFADSSGKLSSKVWNIYQGIPDNSNNEAEYYTDSSTNLHIKNGALSLVAAKQTEPDGYQYSSARIDTDGKISFLYGRINVTAKLPDSIGSWPAVWLLPANSKYEDLSPASNTDRYLNGGEIDMIEEVGFQPNTEYGVVHSLSDLSNPGQVGAYNTVYIPNNNTQYNTYSLLWTPNTITFEVNNTPFFTYTKQADSNYTTWPFNQPFYLILDLALGGVWGGEDTVNFPDDGIDNAALPVSMSVKSIFYYPYTGNN